MKHFDPLSAFAAKPRARSLSQAIVESIGAQISNGSLATGQKLPTETELMQQHGVSRTVIREAMSRLQAAGLIETRHGIGSFVSNPSTRTSFQIDPNDLVTIQDILAVLQLRQSLESAAAGIAALRRSEQDLAVMREVLDEFKVLLEQGESTVDVDYRFHHAIAQATGNRYFAEFMSYLGKTVIPRTRIDIALQGTETQRRYLRRVHEEHMEIYRAIQLRNPLIASSAMQVHLNNSAERLRPPVVE